MAIDELPLNYSADKIQKLKGSDAERDGVILGGLSLPEQVLFPRLVDIYTLSRSGSTALFGLLVSMAGRAGNLLGGIFQPAKGITRHDMHFTIPQDTNGDGLFFIKETGAPKAFETLNTGLSLVRSGKIPGDLLHAVQGDRLPLAAFMSIRNFVPDASAEDFIAAAIQMEKDTTELIERGAHVYRFGYDLMGLTGGLIVQKLYEGLCRANLFGNNPPTFNAEFDQQVLFGLGSPVQWGEAKDPDYRRYVVEPTLQKRPEYGYEKPSREKLQAFADANREAADKIQSELTEPFRQALLASAGQLLGEGHGLEGRIEEFIRDYTF